MGLTRWGRMAAQGRNFFKRHWQKALRIRERFRVSEETFHLLLAGAVGLMGGLTNLAFFWGTESFKFFLWHFSGNLEEVAQALAGWQRFAGPAAGGLAAGLVLYFGRQVVQRQRAPNLLEVVVVGDGRLPFRSALIKSLSSLLSISTGASIGREGAISTLTATLASKWGQIARWEPYRLRLLVACGAASGIAAAYNAPIAGAVFAASIVLGNFSMTLFAPLVFASVVASMVSRTFFGIEPWYQDVPDYNITSVVQLPWFIVLGILAGALGAIFLKLLRETEGLFKRRPLPVYVRLMVAGMIVGVIAIFFPGVWGNGYAITNNILHGNYPMEALSGLFIAKLVATVITVGAGTVGGVLTPTVFLGAGLGSLFGMVLHWSGQAESIPTGTFAVVGMAGVLAATTHSPLLSIILIFEISLNYSLMPSLMIASVVATLVARRIHPDSVYTETLREKGVLAQRESVEPGAATERIIASLMHAPVPPLPENATLQEIGNRFLTSPNNFLPVVDPENRLLGVIALHDLKEYLNAGNELRAVIAYDVMRPPPPCLTPNMTLSEALPVLLSSEHRNVPVVNSLREMRLIGSVLRSEALGLLSEAIAGTYASARKN